MRTTDRTTQSSSGSTSQPSLTPAPARVTPMRPPTFAREWPRVRIDRLELHRAIAPSPLAAVRACVFLGGLLPVDVIVEMTFATSADASAADRMWCEHAYENGSFQFEAHVADEMLARARRIVVHVRPASLAPVGEVDRVVPAAELTLSPTTGTNA